MKTRRFSIIVLCLAMLISAGCSSRSHAHNGCGAPRACSTHYNWYDTCGEAAIMLTFYTVIIVIDILAAAH